MVNESGRDHLWFDGTGAAPERPPANVGWVDANRVLMDVGPAEDIPATVRSLALRDLPRLRELDDLHAVNQPEALVLGNHRMRDAVRAALPGQRGKRPAFVAESGDRIVGYVGFRAIQPDGRWMLHALGAAVGVYAAEPVWERLLEHAVRQAGLRGVRTLHARIPWGIAVRQALARTGWMPYATETVFQSAEARPPGGPTVRPRLQEPADTWAIHQLHSAATPAAVQQAEAFTSRRWEIPPSRARRGPSVAGLVFEMDGSIVAYVRAVRGDRSRAVDLLIHPDHRELTGRIIDGTLLALGSRGARRTWWTVRGYQSELIFPLQQRGFVAAFEQELLVRYTTATVRRGTAEMAHFTLDVRERVPRRVPTFLSGAHEDRSAG